MDLYTKNGRPLQVYGEIVYSRSGTVVGRIISSKVYDPNGRYVGTIDGDTLVYRSIDNAGIRSTFLVARVAAIAKANRSSLAIQGEEPKIPD